MKLTAHLSIDVTVRDYLEAADFQTGVEAAADALRSAYPDLRLEIRERRDRRAAIGRPCSDDRLRPAGRPALSALYEDL